MRQVASTGGKGGTGKSTFAVLLTLKLAKKGDRVVLCDCDVECPNDYLLLKEEIRDPEPILRDSPELNEKICEKCGECSKVCRENAIFWVRGKHPIFLYNLCNGCGACWISCPYNAIDTKKEIIGESFINKWNDQLWLLTGRSKPGVAETGPIVKEVKSRAARLAEEIQADFLVVDTSPGTHCNVIQALMECEKAYIVTEPTPLGVHDARLILELIKKMKIPSEIVLNKADLGDREAIEEIAERYSAPVVLEIPYSEQLVRAYSHGRLEEMVSLV